MKILIMVHALTGGGAERVAASWANGLVRLGHDVSILTHIQKESYSVDKRVKLINQKGFFSDKNSIIIRLLRKFINPVVTFIHLLSIFRKQKTDAVVDVLYMNTYVLLLARLISGSKFPIIMTDHNAYERPVKYAFTWKLWKNKFIDNRFFDVVTVLTKRDKETLNSKGIINVEVLYNPLFLKPLSKVPEKNKTILAVGRIDGWVVKGFDLLIKAWDSIVFKNPEWKLRIVGNGSSSSIEYLKRQISNSQDKIEFAPFTDNIADEYKDAAIFVLSSRYEGWGLVMIEAMSQGCAVIACDYKGRQAEAINDGINGLLCETDNVKAIAEKISILIEDTNLRLKLQENALKSVDYYNEDNVAHRLESIIYDHMKPKS